VLFHIDGNAVFRFYRRHRSKIAYRSLPTTSPSPWPCWPMPWEHQQCAWGVTSRPIPEKRYILTHPGLHQPPSQYLLPQPVVRTHRPASFMLSCSTPTLLSWQPQTPHTEPRAYGFLVLWTLGGTAVPTTGEYFRLPLGWRRALEYALCRGCRMQHGHRTKEQVQGPLCLLTRVYRPTKLRPGDRRSDLSVVWKFSIWGTRGCK